MTFGGVEQSATIGSGGGFSTTFDTGGLTVADSPYTITYAYTTRRDFRLRQYHQHADGHPPLTIFTVNSVGDPRGSVPTTRATCGTASTRPTPMTGRTRSSSIRPCSARPRRSHSTAASSSCQTPGDADDHRAGRGRDHQRRREQPRLSGRQWCDRLDLRPDHLRRLARPGDNGGGLANYGTATLTGCTLSGNSASHLVTAAARRRRVQFRHGQPDPDRLHRQRQLQRRHRRSWQTAATARLTDCTSERQLLHAQRRLSKFRHGQPDDRLHHQRQLRRRPR